MIITNMIYLTVVSLSLTSDLLEQLDEFVNESGYSSRSEAMRLAVRDTLSQYTLQRFERGRIMATVTVIYEKDQRDINPKLMEFRHEFDEYVHGNMHLHISDNYCVEIFIVEGAFQNALALISKGR